VERGEQYLMPTSAALAHPRLVTAAGDPEGKPWSFCAYRPKAGQKPL